MATVICVELGLAVISARWPLIWVMPPTPVMATDSPTAKVLLPTSSTAAPALLIAVMLRDLLAARVTRPVVVSTLHCAAG
ncbi:hypothetical protein D3C85_1793150 [compost metagenome]